MPLPEQSPPGWGADEITKFIDTARGNAYASFANLKAEYGRLSYHSECNLHDLIDAAFSRCTERDKPRIVARLCVKPYDVTWLSNRRSLSS